MTIDGGISINQRLCNRIIRFDLQYWIDILSRHAGSISPDTSLIRIKLTAHETTCSQRRVFMNAGRSVAQDSKSDLESASGYDGLRLISCWESTLPVHSRPLHAPHVIEMGTGARFQLGFILFFRGKKIGFSDCSVSCFLHIATPYEQITLAIFLGGIGEFSYSPRLTEVFRS